MDIHTISIGVVNRYPVHDPGWMLVDTGIPYTQGRVARTMNSLGIHPADIRLIVLTHGHVDHAGSARAIQQLTGARIAIRRQGQPLLEQGLVVVPPVWTQTGVGKYSVGHRRGLCWGPGGWILWVTWPATSTARGQRPAAAHDQFEDAAGPGSACHLSRPRPPISG